MWRLLLLLTDHSKAASIDVLRRVMFALVFSVKFNI